MINLDPGTTYHYAISAENKVTGYWQTETGTFKTLRRVVSVFFEEITMWDDSDDSSPGDMVFKFAINGDQPPTDPPCRPSSKTSATKTVNDTGFIVDAPAQLEITAFGCDDEMESPTSENYCLLYGPTELPLRPTPRASSRPSPSP